MRRYLLIPLALLLVAALGLVGCGGGAASPTPTPAAPAKPAPPPPPVAPTVKLDHVEIGHYESLAKDFPKGYDAKRVGFFELGFVFNVTNPNDYPVQLGAARAAIDFEGGPGKWFAVGAASAYDSQWIPAKYTNQVRLDALFTTRTLLLSLLVPGMHGSMLKELGISPNDMIKKWFEGLPDFKFKTRANVELSFSSPYGSVTSTFFGTFPK